eukprot:7552325-Alexandrium_andersonii.AAC.1
MSASLVGSEMCIRDSEVAEVAGPPRARGGTSAAGRVGGEAGGRRALPTARDPAGSNLGRTRRGKGRAGTGGSVDGALGGHGLGLARLCRAGRVHPAARPL